MGRLIISLHITMDGFVAGPKGEMDWVGLDEGLFDYVGKITDSAGTAFYGRNTFEMMDAYWPTAGKEEKASKHDKEHSAWYNKVNKIVLSNSMAGQEWDKVTFINRGMLADTITDAKQKDNILVFGSPGAVHALFAENLVDEIYLFVNPVLLGDGIPLFKGIKEVQKWKPEETTTFKSCNVVGLHYSKI